MASTNMDSKLYENRNILKNPGVDNRYAVKKIKQDFSNLGNGEGVSRLSPPPPHPPTPHQPKICSFPSPPGKKNRLSPLNNNFQHNIFGCSHHSCQIFILTSYSLYTQVMLMFFFNNVQYLQNVSFEKSSNGKNHCSSGSHYPIKNSYFPFRKI